LPLVDDLGQDAEGLNAPRRDFLKMMGFSVTAATLAASCEMPVRKAIPYVIKPEEVTPGIATWYASTFMNGGDWCPILVKTREGRPIKIEGNPNSPITQGGIDAKALASVLDLYSTKRLSGPRRKASTGYASLSWADADTAIKGKLEANPQARIAVLTNTVLSPSTKAAVARFRETYPNTVHVAYDPVSMDGVLEANAADFGHRAMPAYRFDTADVVVSFGCDYLGSWGSTIQNQKGWAARRKVSPKRPDMSRTYQFESWMSRTGSNADYRVPVSEGEVVLSLMMLHDRIAAKAGAAQIGGLPALDNAKAVARLDKAAGDLWKARGASIVCSGSNSVEAQHIVNRINTLLGNYGKTLQWEGRSFLSQGNEKAFRGLTADMQAGKVDVLIVAGANPVYDRPGFAQALEKVATSISTAGTMDETASLCGFVLPDHHNLESWNDAEAAKGEFSLVQPTIRPLFDSRAFQQSLLDWAGDGRSWYDFLAGYWNANILGTELNRKDAWNKALQTGVYSAKVSPMADNLSGEDQAAPAAVPVAAAASRLKQAYANRPGSVDIVVYEDPLIGNGAYTSNPWLQETPDPITKITWDHFAMVNPGWLREQGLSNGQHVQLKSARGTIEVPVFAQPGTARNVFAVAVGFGRTHTGFGGTDVGGNAYLLQSAERGNWVGGDWTAVTGSTDFALNQDYDSLFDDSKKKRPHVKETTLAEYAKDPMAGNRDREVVLGHLRSFYPDRFRNKNGFHWGLSVDLNSCIGCGACHIACQSENNIPVVGKVEMERKHEMHWMRIDRYYAGSEDDPEVVFQPMMCQHCDQAPCENVCPVAATNHSSEGLNQMAYNRCIGTRYCANNCPYKVRRFNWYDYLGGDSFGDFNDKDALAVDGEKGLTSPLTRMVLNPDVTVRSRGVMEKCSFCVQRIQEGKLTAKMEGRPLKDGDIKTACQTACATGAITFGNLFDNESKAYKEFEEDARAFRVLEEFHTLPSVNYLTKVRNKDAADHIHDVPYEGTLNQA
jgi:molybdopterin-containing oxidoreductase family iron-sulfur binding subunit